MQLTQVLHKMLYQRSCILFSFTRPLGCVQFMNRTHPSALSLLATQTLTLRLVLLAVALLFGQPRSVYSDPFLLWCNYDNTHAIFAYLSSRRFNETLCEIRQKTIQIPTSQLDDPIAQRPQWHEVPLTDSFFAFK